MDVVFAFDDLYADRVPVAVESLLRTQTGHSIRVWLATTADAARDVEDAAQRQACGRATLRLLVVGDTYRSLGRSLLKQLDYVSAAAYMRLFLPDILPETVDRYIYLDSDVLVEGDLEELSSMPMCGLPLAAVRDLFTPTVGAQGGIPGRPHGLSDDAPYFNSGVLLVDRAAWQRRDVTEVSLEYLERNRHRLRFVDQDSLNIACYDAWVELDRKWNYQGWWPDPGEVESRPSDVRVTHYVGRRKPWEADFPLQVHRIRYGEMAERAARASRRPAFFDHSSASVDGEA
jgi:lipopolysaccharide biosynthesis glycosyltransferase